MDLSSLSPELKRRLAQGIADGLNTAADAVREDIRSHVQYQSGELSRSWEVQQRATAQDWTIQVSSPLDRAQWHYPPVPQRIPTERNRALQNGNALFGSDGDTSKVENLLTQSIENAIRNIL